MTDSWDRKRLIVDTKKGAFLFEDEEGRLSGWQDDLGNMSIYLDDGESKPPLHRSGMPLMQFRSWDFITYGDYAPVIIEVSEPERPWKPEMLNTVSVGHDPGEQDEWRAKGYKITDKFSKNVIMTKMEEEPTLPGQIGTIVNILDGLGFEEVPLDEGGKVEFVEPDTRSEEEDRKIGTNPEEYQDGHDESGEDEPEERRPDE